MSLDYWHRKRQVADARAGRRAKEPVADWPAPRGRRDADGRWACVLADRTDDNCSSALEASAVAQLRGCVMTLREARRAQGLTLRQLSDRTGLALSVLTGLEQGSAWPSFPVLGTVADALQVRVQLTSSAVHYDWWRAEQMWTEAGRPIAGCWHQIVIQQLLDFRAAGGLSAREVALRVGLHEETVGELSTHEAPKSWVTVKVLVALAAFYSTALEVVPRGRPWPSASQVPEHETAARRPSTPSTDSETA